MLPQILLLIVLIISLFLTIRHRNDTVTLLMGLVATVISAFLLIWPQLG